MPYRVLLEARWQAARLVVDLDRALTLAPPAPLPPASADGHEPDRLLTPTETAAYLGRTLRWIRRHGRHLPGRVVLSPRAIGYQRAALERLVRQRAGK
ncbi:MAG: hypothetical protein L0027_16725 [Candidatus Rokubacteria bacterium]|nr:hypothetical protein [Candidatus Rokubacteria bacterium]